MGLTFPSDLGNYGVSYWMSFAFYAYNGQTVSQNGSFGSGDAIRLPIPNNLIDTQQINYSDTELPLAVGLSNSLGGGFTGAVVGAGVTAAVNGSPAQKLASGLNTPGIAQQGGVAVNPFLTVLFKSPAFKRYRFRWKLSPTNSGDTSSLNAIINLLKYNQLPSQSSILLTYPNIIQPSISVAGSSYFTFLMKPMVIEQLQVNYTPSGQPAFFNSTQAPVEVELEMSLLEIEWFLQTDYAGLVGGTGVAGVTPAMNPTTQTVVNALNGTSLGQIATGLGNLLSSTSIPVTGP